MQEETKKEHTATEKSSEKKKVNLDIRPYLAIGLTAILVVMICIAIFFLIFRFDGLFAGFQKIMQSLQAIIVGLIVAYLLNPIMKWFERFLYKKNKQKSKELTQKQCQKIRAASVGFAMAVFLAIIVVLIWLIIPQLVVCIEDIVLSMNESAESDGMGGSSDEAEQCHGRKTGYVYCRWVCVSGRLAAQECVTAV